MNSSLLISKIKRLLDTDGSCGDGPSVATAYANAVNQANRRLNTCMSYLSEGQHSEAIRIAEENPALLDECAMLSFVQFPMWQSLCMENGWDSADTINEYSIEKLNAIYGSATALEPLLKTYRKAIRSQDQMLSIRCLRRIVSMDKGNVTWQQDLAAFESKYLLSLKVEYIQAYKEANRSTMLRIADEVESGGWSVPVDASLLGDIVEMRKADQEGIWKVQFAEDVELLRKAFDNKSFRKTQKYLSNIQAMESYGFIPPVAEKGLLEDVFLWCKEMEEKERLESVRNQLSADLHKSIELENEPQIRSILSSPEFADSPPDEDLERRARMVLQRFEIKRSRKRKQICAFIAFVLIGVAIAGGLKFKQVRHDSMKVALIKRLELAHTQQDEKALRNILNEAKATTPELYEDGAIKIWEQKQSETDKQNTMKRQAFDLVVQDIQKIADAEFKDCDQSEVRNKLNAAKKELPPNDPDRNTRLAKLLSAFDSYCLETAKIVEKTATDALEILAVKTIEQVELLKSSPYTKAVENNIETIKGAFSVWHSSYSNSYPMLEVKYKDALASLVQTEQEAKAVFEQLERIKTVKNIDEWIACRDVLVKYCSTYPEVTPLQALMKTPYKDASDGTLSVLRQAASEAKKYDLANAGDKLTAVCTDIKEYRDIKAQTEMYAVYPQGTGSTKAAAILYSLKPPVRSPSPKGVGERVKGVFWQPKKDPEGFSDQMIDTLSTLTFSLMPHCKYINALISKTEDPALNAQSMLEFLFEELQSALKNPDLTEYKRIQLVKIYCDYIEMLTNVSVANLDIQSLFSNVKRLAQPLKIGNDQTVSWLLMDFKDVQEREKECMSFLSQNKNVIAQLRYPLLIQSISALIARQKVVFIGTVDLSANNQKSTMNFVNPKEAYGSIFALRMEGTSYKLRYVLEHTGDRYFLSSKDTALLPGEPLFVLKVGAITTSLKQEAKLFQKIYQVKDSGVKLDHIPAWPVGLEVK